MEIVQRVAGATDLPYSFVPDSAVAWFVPVVVSSQVHCGLMKFEVQGLTITSGVAAMRPDCATKWFMAHEFFHYLGLMGHSPDGTDVLSPSPSIGAARDGSSPSLEQAVFFFRSVPAGTIPIG